MTSSYVGENKDFERQFLGGDLEVELTPQGTLAEKLRAGGSGIAAFFTPTGVGTQMADGGLPLRYDGAGGIAAGVRGEGGACLHRSGSHARLRSRGEHRDRLCAGACGPGDRHGNLVFNKSARNFNPLPRWPARSASPRSRSSSSPARSKPDAVHLPGVFVHRVVEVGPDIEKRIEKRTVAEPEGK